jgi:hypothetical protein
MIMHTKELLEYETPTVTINPNFLKLITTLRTATLDDSAKLNKEETTHDNIFYAFRLALKGVEMV